MRQNNQEKTTLTKNNHFETFRNKKIWKVKYGRCNRKPSHFLEECINTAKEIKKITDKKVKILFSGGVDSEVVALSFEMANIPFDAVTVRFKSELNSHDFEWAEKICLKRKWNLEIYELDLLNFWKSELFYYTDMTQSISPQFPVAMWLVDQIEGFPVLGSGECLLQRENGNSRNWVFYEKEKVASLYRFFDVRKRSGCPGFFQYTPEIMLSYLQDPLIVNWLNDERHGQISTTAIKMEHYQKYFNIEPRPKYTGFEKVIQSDLEYRKLLTEKYPDCDRVCKTDYVELVKNLSPSPSNRIFNWL